MSVFSFNSSFFRLLKISSILMLSLVVFSLSDKVLYIFAIFILWLYGLFEIPSKLYIAKFYLLIFGLFFILPMIILGDIDFISEGTILKNIHLKGDQVIIILNIIYLYLFCYILTAYLFIIFLNKNTGFYQINRNKPIIKNIQLYYLFVLLLSIIVIGFNLVEISAVYEQGYDTLQKGNLTVKKNLFVLFSEVFLLSLLALGIASGKKIAFYILQLYAMTLVFTGIRMPGVTLAFFSFLFFYPHMSKKFVFILFLGLVLAPQVLMFSQALRVYGFAAIEHYSFLNIYIDLVKVLGFTVDTLKASIIVDKTQVDISPFYKVYEIFSVFLERVLNFNLGFSLNAFGPELTKYYDYDLYERTGTTFGSSSIAEAWFYGSYFGVGLLGFFSFVLSYYFSKLKDCNCYIGAVIFILFVPRFIMSIRNELLGWFFESMIFFVLSIPFVYIVHTFFVTKKNTLPLEHR